MSGKPNAGRPITPPVIFSATFEFDTTAALIAESHRLDSNFYSRYSNPTVRAAEAAVAKLEHAEMTLAFGSGMAALSTVLLTHLKAGDRILAQDALYGGTQQLMTVLLPRLGIHTDFVPPGELVANFKKYLKPQHKLLHLETPVNPLIQLVDVRKLSGFARKAGLLTMVDATFATPYLQQTLSLGADFSMHSTTKGMGGHSDILGGVVSGSKKLLTPVWTTRKLLGGVMDPMTAYLLWRGLESLPARLDRQQRSAQAIAKFLAASKKIKSVSYPGLPTYPQRKLLKAQMRGTGSMITFDCGLSLKATSAAVDKFKLIKNAPSLGGTESLFSLPALTSQAGFTPAERRAAGITDGLVRFSVGMEEPKDLIADLKQAFRL